MVSLIGTGRVKNLDAKADFTSRQTYLYIIRLDHRIILITNCVLGCSDVLREESLATAAAPVGTIP